MVKNITDLPPELLYKIIEDYNTDDEKKKNYWYEGMDFVNYQNDVYELFKLQKPRKHYKEYFYNVVGFIIEDNECDACFEFKPFDLFDKRVERQRYDRKKDCDVVYIDDERLCSECYLEDMKKVMNKVFKEMKKLYCKECYIFKPFKNCIRCEKNKLLNPLLKECFKFAKRQGENWISTHTTCFKFLDRIIVERNSSNNIIGFLIILLDRMYGVDNYIIKFALVSKRHRRKGVLKKLLKQLPKGFVLLEPLESKIEMWKNLGWNEMDEVMIYYGDDYLHKTIT